MIRACLEATNEIVESMGSSGVLQHEGTFLGSGKGGGSVRVANCGLIK